MNLKRFCSEFVLKMEISFQSFNFVKFLLEVFSELSQHDLLGPEFAALKFTVSCCTRSWPEIWDQLVHITDLVSCTKAISIVYFDLRQLAVVTASCSYSRESKSDLLFFRLSFQWLTQLKGYTVIMFYEQRKAWTNKLIVILYWIITHFTSLPMYFLLVSVLWFLPFTQLQ